MIESKRETTSLNQNQGFLGTHLTQLYQQLTFCCGGLFANVRPEHQQFLQCLLDTLEEVLWLYQPLLEVTGQSLPRLEKKLFQREARLTISQRQWRIEARLNQLQALIKIAAEEVFLELYSTDQVNLMFHLLDLINQICEEHQQLQSSL